MAEMIERIWQIVEELGWAHNASNERQIAEWAMTYDRPLSNADLQKLVMFTNWQSNRI